MTIHTLLWPHAGGGGGGAATFSLFNLRSFVSFADPSDVYAVTI